MLKRSVFLQNAQHVSVVHSQLLFTCKQSRQERKVPPEDLAYLVLEHPQSTFTQYAVEACMAQNVAVIFCNAQHLPSAMLLNMVGHSLQTRRMQSQAQCGQATKNRLWKQIIQAKILAQAAVLHHHNKNQYAGLKELARGVSSGDKGIHEAIAAKIYFSALFAKPFIRDRDAGGANAALNYGYALLRAAVARALVGSGLHPSLGIHHKNQYNAFVLADDFMEPLRPMVDLLVFALQSRGMDNAELSMAEKQSLLKLLAANVYMRKQRSPLMVALQHYAASYAAVLEGQQKKLLIPTLYIKHAEL